MSTPQYCPGCGNRCSLDSPSCSTGEAYLRSLRQARKKKAAQASETAPVPGQPAVAPVSAPPAPEPAPKTVSKASPGKSGTGARPR